MPSRSPASRLSKVAARLVLPAGARRSATGSRSRRERGRSRMRVPPSAGPAGHRRREWRQPGLRTPGLDRSAEYVAEQLEVCGGWVRPRSSLSLHRGAVPSCSPYHRGLADRILEGEASAPLANSGAGAVSARLLKPSISASLPTRSTSRPAAAKPRISPPSSAEASPSCGGAPAPFRPSWTMPLRLEPSASSS